MRPLVAIAVSLLIVGCSNAPSSPTSPTTGTSGLGGTWVGSASDPSNGSGTMRVELTDVGTFGGITGLSGTWTSTFSDGSKNSSGQAGGTVENGLLLLRLAPTTRPTCTSQPVFWGQGDHLYRAPTATTNLLRGTYLFVTCTGTVDGTFELRRQ